MLKTLLSQVKQYKKPAILTPVFTALEVFMELLLPYMMSFIIDRGIYAENMGNVYKYGLGMIGIALVSLFSGIMAGRCSAEAGTGFAANLRNTLYTKVQSFSFSNIDKFSTAGLVTRMTTDVMNIQNAFQMILRMCFRAPLSLISALVMAILINASLAKVFLVAIVFLVIALFIITRVTMGIFSQVFERYDDLNRSVQENVTGIRVVKAFVREDHEIGKFSKAADNLYKLFIKAETMLALNGPVMMLAVNGSIIAISWLGAKMVVSETMTTGELTMYFSYVMNVLMSLMMLSMVFVMITMSLASARRIAEVMKEVPDITEPEKPVTEVRDGSIDFDHVNFSYKTEGSGEFVLKDIDLHIKSGETIGIIGATGSAKSTLVNLISRLYDATEGSVKVGGRDVKEYGLTALRDQVSVVLQKNVLFTGTIFENLRWGKEDASDEECIQAAKLACADEFISSFPDGYNTYIEQGGNNVSGGQKQRLCIARALLKSPKILILDDSTSAVDTATDAKIRQAMKEVIPGTTKIIIAQRISSVQEADRILVLNEGTVDAFDTHENLVKNNDIYREIYEGQIKGGGDFDKPQ